MIGPKLAIAGVGLVGGFGTGKQALLDVLSNGGRPNATVTVNARSGPRQLPVYQADVAGARPFIGGGAWRRMNRLGKLAVLGASLALEDAGWDVPLNREDVGLIVASGYGASKSTFDFLGIAMENQAAAESRIRDLDVSAEIVDFTKNQILVQTGAAALAQANVAPQSVLQLLQ